MRRSAGFKDILIDLIEDHQDEIEALDPEYLEGGSALAEEKYEALHSGDLSLAMSLTSNYKLMTIFQDIEEEMKKLSSRRSASQIINNLESRIARLEKQSRRNHRDIELDEDGNLVHPDYVGDQFIDLSDVGYEILDDVDFQERVEEEGDDIDDIDESDLELTILEGVPSRKHKDIFYFIVEETVYGFGAVVSVDLEGEPSIDYVGDINGVWDTFNRWT